MGPTMPNNSDPPDGVDGEIQTLGSFLYGLQFFRRKNLSIRHLKVLLATEMIRLNNANAPPPTRLKIATHLKLRERDIRQEVCDLVEMRLLHEIIPRFGDCDNCSYKLGPLGGSVMKKILDR